MIKRLSVVCVVKFLKQWYTLTLLLIIWYILAKASWDFRFRFTSKWQHHYLQSFPPFLIYQQPSTFFLYDKMPLVHTRVPNLRKRRGSGYITTSRGRGRRRGQMQSRTKHMTKVSSPQRQQLGPSSMWPQTKPDPLTLKTQDSSSENGESNIIMPNIQPV